jgi:hypothetical protein
VRVRTQFGYPTSTEQYVRLGKPSASYGPLINRRTRCRIRVLLVVVEPRARLFRVLRACVSFGFELLHVRSSLRKKEIAATDEE